MAVSVRQRQNGQGSINASDRLSEVKEPGWLKDFESLAVMSMYTAAQEPSVAGDGVTRSSAPAWRASLSNKIATGRLRKFPFNVIKPPN
jgi:hypothetical protein